LSLLSNEKPVPGQQSTSKKHVTLMSSQRYSYYWCYYLILGLAWWCMDSQVTTKIFRSLTWPAIDGQLQTTLLFFWRPPQCVLVGFSLYMMHQCCLCWMKNIWHTCTCCGVPGSLAIQNATFKQTTLWLLGTLETGCQGALCITFSSFSVVSAFDARGFLPSPSSWKKHFAVFCGC